MPTRIQRKRTKGFHLPAESVYVGRPSKWGNPFTPAGCREAGYKGTDEQIKQRCVEAFRAWLGPNWEWNWGGEESRERREFILNNLEQLRGKDLSCWCPLDQPCHADVLLELANE